MGRAGSPRDELRRGPAPPDQLREPRQEGGTLRIIVFPAVDIQGGKAVRLRRGDFDDVTVFGDDPVSLARLWQDQGAEALHVVDLDAARTGELVNFDILERIVQSLDIPVQYGGGVRSAKSLALVAGLGVHWVVMGTAAVTARDLLA